MCAFDVLVILKQNTGLDQSDVLLAEDALSCGLPLIFVQSKCDNLLRDALEDQTYTAYDAEGRAVVPTAAEAANLLVAALHEGHRNSVAQYAAAEYKLDGRKLPFFAKHGRDIPFFCVSSRVLYAQKTGQQSGDYAFDETEFVAKLIALKNEARAWTDEELNDSNAQNQGDFTLL